MRGPKPMTFMYEGSALLEGRYNVLASTGKLRGSAGCG
jgi:hypothetical protein